jgi:hypothetical protein
LSEAVAQLPARYRRRIVFRADGAGATKDLLEWIKDMAAERGWTWHYGVGFDVTDPFRTAVTAVPAGAWACALPPGGQVRREACATEPAGLFTLAGGWPKDVRVMARTEPLHPEYREQAGGIEKKRGRGFQAVGTDLPGRHYPRLDAFHRNHAGVESVIKDGKDLGLRRLPSFRLAVSQARCLAVALAADLPAWLRLLAVNHHTRLRRATRRHCVVPC